MLHVLMYEGIYTPRGHKEIFQRQTARLLTASHRTVRRSLQAATVHIA